MLFQQHVFSQYLIISESIKYTALLHIIVVYIKENIIVLQKFCRLHRNRRASNKLSALNLKKPFCRGNLSPAHKIFIERPIYNYV